MAPFGLLAAWAYLWLSGKKGYLLICEKFPSLATSMLLANRFRCYLVPMYSFSAGGDRYDKQRQERELITDHDKDVLQIVTFSLQIRKAFSLLITTSL